LILSIRRKFITLIVAVGLIIAGIVYYCLGSALRERYEQQASLIATSLADTAAGYVLSKDALGPHSLVAKYGELDGVAYAIIQDRDGNVIANSLISLSPEIQKNLSHDERSQTSRRDISLEGKPITEIRRPILQGRLGAVRLGVWSDTVENEIHNRFLLLIIPLTLVLVTAIIVAAFLANRLIGPFNRLITIADRISTGDLDVPIRSESQDEFGKLTHSLERMRSSLKAAMVRLEQN
jgi:methyl-accepting chemotaxis protein